MTILEAKHKIEGLLHNTTDPKGDTGALLEWEDSFSVALTAAGLLAERYALPIHRACQLISVKVSADAAVTADATNYTDFQIHSKKADGTPLYATVANRATDTVTTDDIVKWTAWDIPVDAAKDDLQAGGAITFELDNSLGGAGVATPALTVSCRFRLVE